MESRNSAEIQLNVPIASVIRVESYLLSTKNADFFRGFDLSDGSSLSFWLLRGRLSSEHKEKFLARLAQIDELNLASCPIKAYGVDSDGRGFAIFPGFDASPIIAGNVSSLDSREAERRFFPCMQSIEKLHQSGVAMGDLCSNSFIIDRSGKVFFIGVMGDFHTTPIASSSAYQTSGAPVEVSSEILHYIAPERRAMNNQVSAAEELDFYSDVFALGTLGYRLFAGKFPFANLTLEQLVDPQFALPALAPLSTKGASIPSWCDHVFSKCLHAHRESRYVSVVEIQSEIHALREKLQADSALPLAVGKSSNDSAKNQEKDKGPKTFKPLGETNDENGDVNPSKVSAVQQKKIIISVIVIVLVCVAFLTLKKGSSESITPQVKEEIKHEEVTAIPDQDLIQDLVVLKDAVTETTLKSAIEILSQKNSSIDDKILKLKDLVASSDAIAQEALIISAIETEDAVFRDLVQKAIIDRLKRIGSGYVSEQLRQWIRTIGTDSLPDIYESMLRVVNPQQAIAARIALLKKIYPLNSQYALRIAAAMLIDSKRVQDYQAIIAELFGDSLSIKDANQRSAYALLLIQPEISKIFNDQIIQRQAEIPDGDLLWLIGILAMDNDPRVRQLTDLALNRNKISSLRKVFLSIINERPDIGSDVMVSLVRAASGLIDSSDVAQLGGWADELSEKALLVFCIEISDSKLLSEAFETLAAKTLTIQPAVGLVEVIRSKYWDQRSDLAPLVAAASLPGLLPTEVVEAQLKKLTPFLKDNRLMDLLASSEDPFFSKTIVDRYPDSLGLGSLLKLLTHSDKNIRIKAVLALKHYNQIGALKLILGQYDKEKDPDVLKVYKESFWMIEERDAKNKAQNSPRN